MKAITPLYIYTLYTLSRVTINIYQSVSMGHGSHSPTRRAVASVMCHMYFHYAFQSQMGILPCMTAIEEGLRTVWARPRTR